MTAMVRPDKIQQNARAGEGSCKGCPAQEEESNDLVNPGLGSPGGRLVFVTEEPRHLTKWGDFDHWRKYNAEWLPRFVRADGGQFINRLLSLTDLRTEDVWITDSIKCPTKQDPGRGISGVKTNAAFDRCRAYLGREIEAHDPVGVVTLGREATRRTLRELGVPAYKTDQIRVSMDYGRCEFETTPPVIISLHWAQRTVPEDEWISDVQRAIAEVVD